MTEAKGIPALPSVPPTQQTAHHSADRNHPVVPAALRPRSCLLDALTWGDLRPRTLSCQSHVPTAEATWTGPAGRRPRLCPRLCRRWSPPPWPGSPAQPVISKQGTALRKTPRPPLGTVPHTYWASAVYRALPAGLRGDGASPGSWWERSVGHSSEQSQSLGWASHTRKM